MFTYSFVSSKKLKKNSIIGNNETHSILISLNAFQAFPSKVLTVKLNVRKEFSQPQSNFHKKERKMPEKFYFGREIFLVFFFRFQTWKKWGERKNSRRMWNLWFYYLYLKPFFHVFVLDISLNGFSYKQK